MKYSEKWGDSIESAINLALQDLRLTIDQVTVTVLEEPSKGFFGIGSKLAKVRVEEKEPVKVEELSQKPAETAKKNEAKAVSAKSDKPANAEFSEKPAPEKKKRERKKKNNNSKRSAIVVEEKESVSQRPDDLQEVSEHPAKAFLEQVVRDMGIEVSVTTFINADSVYVDIEGKDTGTVIGKRGATLDAIQYLTSLVVNKGEDDYIRVIVDAEGYRAKREAILEKLAIRLAEKAVKTGRSVKLEPMNPYERKIIHTTLQAVPSVTTKSEGDEPYRRVVILPVRH